MNNPTPIIVNHNLSINGRWCWLCVIEIAEEYSRQPSSVSSDRWWSKTTTTFGQFSNNHNLKRSNFVRLTAAANHLSYWIHFPNPTHLTLPCTTPDALRQRHRGIYKHFASKQPNILNSCSSELWIIRLHGCLFPILRLQRTHGFPRPRYRTR